MKSNAFGAALLMSSALAVGAFAPSTATGRLLTPGNYMIAGIQPICLVSGGAWYGEAFAWNGRWRGGPSDQTAIFGNYNAGAGNDSIIVTKGKVQWTEWTDDLSFQNTVTGTVTRTSGRCMPPATTAKSGHHNPMD